MTTTTLRFPPAAHIAVVEGCWRRLPGGSLRQLAGRQWRRQEDGSIVAEFCMLRQRRLRR